MTAPSRARRAAGPDERRTRTDGGNGRTVRRSGAAPKGTPTKGAPTKSSPLKGSAAKGSVTKGSARADTDTRTRGRRTAADRGRIDHRIRPSGSPSAPVSTPPALGAATGRVDPRAGRGPFIALVLGLAAAGLISLVLLNTAINENAFRLHALDQKQEVLDRQERELQRDVADRESPGSLAAAAKRLGLVPAGQPAFIKLPDGQIVGVPTPAKAAAPVVKPKPKPSPVRPSASAAANPAAAGTKPSTPAAR